MFHICRSQYPSGLAQLGGELLLQLDVAVWIGPSLAISEDTPCAPVGTGVTAWLSFEESFSCLPL
jgi:hypothetical protein